MSEIPTPIRKTIFTFEVLHRVDEPFEGGDENTPFDNVLGQAMERSWDGHAVGAITKVEHVDLLLPETVRDELVELGNDGEFFDDDLNPEED